MRQQMRGVSAASLVDVLAAVDTVSDPRTVSTELFTAVSAIDGTPALRRILTDPSTATSGKQGLATDVFGAKVSDETMAVLKAAVSGRWASVRDLTDGLEIAGVAAEIAATPSNELDTLEDDLFAVGQVVSKHSELRAVVADRSVPAAAKASLLDSVFGGKIAPSALALAKQAAVARLGSFEKAIAAFGAVVAERRGRLVAVVRTATGLDPAQGQRLAEALAKKYGRQVHLNTVVDTSVVGGIAVSVGDEVVDGTMSTRLESARRQLAG